MTTRVLTAVAVVAVVVAVAWWMERRRRRDVPTQGAPVVPAQLDRADFPEPERPWLVVLFTSEACSACDGLPAKAAPLAGPEVAVVEVGFPAQRELQERYRINAVPLTVVVDSDGVVRTHFVGAFTATDLWGALADLRG